MAFSSLSDFIAMGGYGFYVWLAYGVSFLSIFILILNTINKRKKILYKVEQRLQREQRIRAAEKREHLL